MRTNLRPAWVCIIGLLAGQVPGWAARFAEHLEFTQPGGKVLQLRGEGNEFQAVYEDTDGYTVVFDVRTGGYCYAAVDETGTQLVSVGVEAGSASPPPGLPKHVRLEPELAGEQARQVKAERDRQLRLPKRWAELKAGLRQSETSSLLRYGPTLGTKVGLTLLIEFEGSVSGVPREDVVEFLNGDDYAANQNNGSVKAYFADVSGGNLLYTNIVLGYIRIPATVQPRSYYNDLNRASEGPVNELIRDAIRVMTNEPSYLSEVVPRLSALSLDEAGEVLALNVFVAGADSGVWAKGLWPHMGALSTVGPQELWPGGLRVNLYQMTTMRFAGEPPTIGVFCHETGHLLCGFPDIYDYDNQSSGGAGEYCLMSHQFVTNPQHPCAYLKLAAGWATVTDVRAGAPLSVALNAPGTNGNHFLRYRASNFSREYFLMENRQKSGRDIQLPGAGILIWHIDELGDHNNQNLLPNSIHANYEVTLVQADNRWDLQRGQNAGDGQDLYYRGNLSAGYQNRFMDTTAPGAWWWNGDRSGLMISDFSVRGPVMAFMAEVKAPAIRRDPLSQTLTLGETLVLSVQMATNKVYAYTWLKFGAPIERSERVAGTDGPMLMVTDFQPSDAGQYSVRISDGLGYEETSRAAQVAFSSLKPMTSVDMGDAAGLSGTTRIVNSSYQVTAGGSGLMGSVDSCRFVYEAVRGDFDVRVALLDLKREDGAEEVEGGAGLMVRAGLEANSEQLSVFVRPGFSLDQGTLKAQVRETRGAGLRCLAQAGGLSAYTNWVRLKREGPVFTTYYSTNGTRWEWLGSATLGFGEDLLVGMAAASYHPLLRSVAMLRSYSLVTNAAPTYAMGTVRSAAVEGSSTAQLRVTASRNGPLDVPITLSEPSLNGTAFTAIGPSLHIPSGTNVGLVDIVPIDNPEAEIPRTVTVTAAAAGVVQSSAAFILLDDDTVGKGLLQETYYNVAGTAIADLTNHYRFPGSVSLGTVGGFETSTAPNSGEVLSGFLTPPATGDYVFYLAAANAAQLWLSADTNAEHAVMVAEERGMNSRRNWAGYGSTTHISAPIRLEQSKWYYVKALHKAGMSGPHLAVAWRTPGGNVPANGSAPISGESLAWALPAASSDSGGRLRFSVLEGGRFWLSFEAMNPMEWVLEESEDLARWTPVSTNAADGGGLTVDTAGTNAVQRFYRARVP